MKNIKKYNDFINESKIGDYKIPDYTIKDYTEPINNPKPQPFMSSLKERLISHFQEQESDFDPEETANVLEILNEYDDNLTGLGNTDKTLLLRMINDTDLYDEVDSIKVKSSNFNAFD